MVRLSKDLEKQGLNHEVVWGENDPTEGIANAKSLRQELLVMCGTVRLAYCFMTRNQKKKIGWYIQSRCALVNP